MAPVFKGKSVQASMYSDSIAAENQQYITANKFNISLFLADNQNIYTQNRVIMQLNENEV